MGVRFTPPPCSHSPVRGYAQHADCLFRAQGMGNMYGGAPPPKKKPDKPLPEWKKKLKPGQLAGTRFALSNCTANNWLVWWARWAGLPFDTLCCCRADFDLAAQQFTKGRLLKNTIKDTKAMLANAEYYVKTMERTLERGSKYVRPLRPPLPRALTAARLCLSECAS
jgi:hypothetical protein